MTTAEEPTPLRDIVQLNNVRYGLSNPDARRVQKALNSRGFSVEVDSHFGDETQNAYIQYQLTLDYEEVEGVPSIKSLYDLGFDVQS